MTQKRIDPWLQRQIQEAHGADVVYALLVLALDTPGAEGGDMNTAVLATATHRVAQEFALVRDFRAAGALLVAGTPALIAALIADERVAIASATTVDLFPAWS